MANPLPRFPASLSAGAGGAARFILDPARFAVRGTVPASLSGRIEDRFEEESLSLISASIQAAESLPETRVLPVYVPVSGGAPYVATGRATIRFREGEDANAHAEALRGHGYRITQVPLYAPHMAWIEGVSDDVARMLAGLGQLASLPGVEHVEPQLISRGEKR
jgi:hypothetical protein